MKYCITHDGVVFLDWDVSDDCIITFCPPPEFEMTDEWLDSLDAPTPPEIGVMDFHARELEADFS